MVRKKRRKLKRVKCGVTRKEECGTLEEEDA